MKVGIGFDVHPLIKGQKLTLGGVDIKYAYGLQGHSDADVLTHALIDAILGALGEGDIGRHFPDSGEKYKDISSMSLLEEIYKLMSKMNYRLNNADLIVITEAPKLTSYSDKIIKNLSSRMNTRPKNINFKATTTEGLGFIGRGEGIAAQAIVSLLRGRGKNVAVSEAEK